MEKKLELKTKNNFEVYTYGELVLIQDIINKNDVLDSYENGYLPTLVKIKDFFKDKEKESKENGTQLTEENIKLSASELDLPIGLKEAIEKILVKSPIFTLKLKMST